MRKLALLFVLFATTAFAVPPQSVYVIDGVSFPCKQLAGADTVKTLPTAYMGVTATRITDADGHRANAVLIQVQTYPIRFYVGGSVPTDTAGLILEDLDSLKLESTSDVETLQFINDNAGSNAVVEVCPYFKP